MSVGQALRGSRAFELLAPWSDTSREGTLGSSSFGLSNGTQSSEREMQFALRFMF